MFRANNATAEVRRFVYVDGKATTKSVVATYEWYLTLKNARDMVDPSMYGKMYHFNTEPDADIRESDDIDIGEDTYSVQMVEHKRGVTLAFTRATLIKDA